MFRQFYDLLILISRKIMKVFNSIVVTSKNKGSFKVSEPVLKCSNAHNESIEKHQVQEQDKISTSENGSHFLYIYNERCHAKFLVGQLNELGLLICPNK